MVAKTPLKQRKAASPPLDPACLRETLVKEGDGMSMSPRMSPRASRLRTSLRCKQVASIRFKKNPPSRSPKEKFPTSSAGGEWRRMSLKGMLVGETIAIKFAGDVVAAVADKSGKRFQDDPRSLPINPCGDIRTRRNLEKNNSLRSSDPCSPALQSACLRINFKVTPPKQRDFNRGNTRYMANRTSPGNKAWVKSPSKYQVKIKSPPKRSAAATAGLWRSLSLRRLTNRLTSHLRGRTQE